MLKVVVRDALFALLSIVRTCVCVVSLRILSETGWKGVDWQRLAQGACCIYLSEYFKEKKYVKGVVERPSPNPSLTLNNTTISYARFSLLALS